MKRTIPAWSRLTMAVLVPAWLLSMPVTAAAGQHSHGSGGSGGSHASGGGGGGGSTGGGGGGGSTSGGGGSSGGHAVPRGSTGGTTSTVGSSSAGRSGSHGNSGGTTNAENAVPTYSRPRDGKPVVGQAVPRSSAPPSTVIVSGGYYGGYYPWGFGGIGLGSYYGGYGYGGYGGYYGGYYDPWYGNYGGYYPYGGYGGYGGGYYPYDSQYGYSSAYEGALRLKVKPKEASVYVDGYYVGIVDDFNGIFHRLHIEPGPHRIEIRASGYEALSFDVRIEPDRTITYTGELKKIQ